jgi:hypothetical protein
MHDFLDATRGAPAHLDEFEYDGKTTVGRAKHWHLFEVIARRD